MLKQLRNLTMIIWALSPSLAHAVAPVPSTASLVCSLVFSDGEHKSQTAFVGELSTADNEMPRLNFEDSNGYVRVRAVSVNYMELLVIGVTLPAQNLDESIHMNTPQQSDTVLFKTYTGDFGRRVTWNRDEPGIAFEATNLEVACSYLL